ncbi:MAG: multifunctional CCA addition/repair protein [Granulosicoccus sp.]
MKRYLVGGAVRDELLGLPVVDRDWVVVGSTPAELLDAGYQSVGKDFPVFLHPETHEEYALARKERKTGPGYHGFAFDTDTTVTLDQDLSRRDLTINAMAKNDSGELLDPFNGKQDLDQRILRHVSEAFIEDPVRILRVARFMARFTHLGFTVAAETNELMRDMVQQGEVNSLVAERVWQETQGALLAQSPRAFFDTLESCQALRIIFPEVHALSGVPQPEQWHPEIDSGVHTMMVVEQAAALSGEVDVRFAALCHDLGKATTPSELLPSHSGHEQRGADISESLCARLRVPRKTRDLAVLTARFHTHCHRARELNASTLAKLLSSLDVVRKPERFEQFLTVCEADARGRLGMEHKSYPQASYLAKAADTFRAVNTSAIANSLDNKSSIPAAILQARVLALKHWLKSSGDELS